MGDFVKHAVGTAGLLNECAAKQDTLIKAWPK